MPITLFSGLKPLDGRRLLRDCWAGVNVASINLPQVLGYARIAGMSVVTGFYTLLLPLVAFALFGSSRHLVVAADSGTAAILSSSLHDAGPGSEHYMALVSAVAMLTGTYLLLARVFKLGFLADFLSRTVLVGFLTGVGFQVGIATLSDMLGIAVSSNYSLVRLWQISNNLSQLNYPTLSISILVAASILLGKRFAPRWPVSLIAVATTIAASSRLHLGEQGVAVLGPILGGLPSIRLPHLSFREILSLLPVSGSCFVMIIAQSAATSRAFALRYHERVDIDADILGLSAANVAAAMSGTFVVNGSPTQTAMADHAGARSQMAQLMVAVVVVLVLLFMTGPLQYFPQCALAAIVFTIAVGMMDFAGLRAIRRESSGEHSLAIATAAAVVALGVEQGILLAIALSLFRHVLHSYRPHTMMLVEDGAGRWIAVPAKPGKVTEAGLIVYRFGADLFYANQNRFTDEVHALIDCAPTPVRWFIIDASAITDIDYSAAQSVRELLDEMARRNVAVIFGRVSSYLRSDLDRHGISAAVGAQRIFQTLHEALAATRGGELPQIG